MHFEELSSTVKLRLLLYFFPVLNITNKQNTLSMPLTLSKNNIFLSSHERFMFYHGLQVS